MTVIFNAHRIINLLFELWFYLVCFYWIPLSHNLHKLLVREVPFYNSKQNEFTSPRRSLSKMFLLWFHYFFFFLWLSLITKNAGTFSPYVMPELLKNCILSASFFMLMTLVISCQIAINHFRLLLCLFFAESILWPIFHWLWIEKY